MLAVNIASETHEKPVLHKLGPEPERPLPSSYPFCRTLSTTIRNSSSAAIGRRERRPTTSERLSSPQPESLPSRLQSRHVSSRGIQVSSSRPLSEEPRSRQAYGQSKTRGVISSLGRLADSMTYSPIPIVRSAHLISAPSSWMRPTDY